MDREEVQGLFYYQAIFKMIRRYEEDKIQNKMAGLNCTTYNGYIVGLSPFHAKEDITINIDNLKGYLKSGRVTKLNAAEIKLTLKILESRSEKEVSFKTLETLITPQALAAQSKTLCP